jgi:hypothetical protein
MKSHLDRLCGLVVRVPGYISRGPGSICCSTRFFRELVGLERGLLSLVRTIEELLGRKNSGPGLENREYCPRISSCWTGDALYLQKLTLTLPASGGRSVGIVLSRTKSTDLSFRLWDRKGRQPLWSSGQSSWLQIRRPGFDSRDYQKESSGSGTGSNQPREYKLRSYLIEK